MSGRSNFPRRLAHTLVGATALMAANVVPMASALAADGPPPVSIIRDTEIEAIIRTDADPIFRAAGLEPTSVKIHLVGDKTLNAFAASGQQMFLNTGLIMETTTPNELIGVIAHETGHIAGGHIARSGGAMRAAMGPMIITMGLGILAALAGAPDAGAALMYSSNYFAQLSVLGYSRTQESAADQAAATYLETAGESGKGLVEFFNNFRFQEVLSESRRFPYFQSHPLSSERIEALRSRVERQPSYGKSDSAEALAEHAIMRAKLAGFINPPSQTFVQFPESDQSYPARYARAIAYYKATETTKALKAIEALIAEQPSNPYLWELKGQVLFESGRPIEAVVAHGRSVELKPDAPLLRINYGQSLLALDDPTRLDEAIAVINRAMVLENDNPLGWRLLSEAYDRKGDAGMARLAAAEENYSLGLAAEARTFAIRARELLPRNSPQWRRATDIILVSGTTREDQQDNDRESQAPGLAVTR